MPAFLARKQYCHTCKKGFTDHPCGDLCKLCNTQNCSLVEWKFCKDCNRFFKSDECFNRHKDDTGPAKSLCRALVKCGKCQRVVTRASINDHCCGKVRCSTCQMYVRRENHKCYLQPVKTRKRASKEEEESPTNFLDDDVTVENDVQDRQEQNLIFFNFECTQRPWRTHSKPLCGTKRKRRGIRVFRHQHQR